MSAWHDCEGRFCVLSSYVRPDYRRRGVARALYGAIEEATGKVLNPAVSLSDSAFEFWKRFRPAAVSQDLRHVRSRLLGEKLAVRGRLGTVIEASGHVMTVKYDDASDGAPNSQTCVVTKSLDEALGMVGRKE